MLWEEVEDEFVDFGDGNYCHSHHHLHHDEGGDNYCRLLSVAKDIFTRGGKGKIKNHLLQSQRPLVLCVFYMTPPPYWCVSKRRNGQGTADGQGGGGGGRQTLKSNLV